MFTGLCELSGQPLATANDNQTVVVTPSGHVCFKNLLLAKLAENGGLDPFLQDNERPLSEDELTEIVTTNSVVPPRPNPATSLPTLLGLVQKEYDALVLELFDTRKALEETRRELSQALYQNDAAVRVIARISQERDTARQQLAQWKANGGNLHDQPASKRLKTESATVVDTHNLPVDNDIPASHLQHMSDIRDELHSKRKTMVKAAVAKAPTTLSDNQDTKSWHKSSCKSVLAVASHGPYIATAGKDKQVIVYDSDKKVVLHTFSLPGAAHLDMNARHVAVGTNSKIALLDYSDGATVASIGVDGQIADVRLHPTDSHIVAATAEGKILIVAIVDNELQHISTFSQSEPSTYTSGVLHPDGLIYAAGTDDGTVDLWDFKNKVLASTMKDGDGSDACVAIAFSNNGYHMATCHESSVVKAWDLRKQKVMATMNAQGEAQLSGVRCLAYDHGGKYLAYGGKSGIIVTTVKEWGVTARYDAEKVSGVAWGASSQWIAASSSSSRTVYFFGNSSNSS